MLILMYDRVNNKFGPQFWLTFDGQNMDLFHLQM
jgi:hypothetical protein